MNNTNTVKGYKVFNSDWSCTPTAGVKKQYTCPGKFEEEIDLDICRKGMHFCKRAIDCFNYNSFDPNNKVAEVIAYGTLVEKGYKCCTDKLEIVREISWAEVLEIVNTGKDCTGIGNSGNCNSGNRNSGNRNSGSWNSGYGNSGYWNSGYWNSGNWNSGHWNSGNRNSGNYNSGDWNSGDWNSGYYNSGDWNSGNYNSGCFNTGEQKIYLFNKPSDWTITDWWGSEARIILSSMPMKNLRYILFSEMTDGEKSEHHEAEITGGYLKEEDNTNNRQSWWDELSADEKDAVKAIPNFDRAIFKEITGIDVGE